MSENFSKLTEDVLYCLKNDLLEDEVGRSILEIYNEGVCDETIATMFENRKSKHQYRQAFYGGIPFKNPKLSKGDYTIGYDQNGKKLLSFAQFLNAHCLLTAGSGAGKTNYSYFKILQIAAGIVGMWLFDLRKREFVRIKSLLAQKGINLTVLSGRDLRINPLQLPTGVKLSDWISRVADMLVQVFELPPRASKLLQSILFSLYRKFDAANNIFPTLYDLFEEIKKNKELNHQARLAILDSLEPVLHSLGPEVLAYRYGWPWHELAKKHLVFDLGGCSETDKNLIMNTPILSVFNSRTARGISNTTMDLLIVVDEAQRLCSGYDQSSAIADMIGLVRGTGIGLDLSLQGTNQLLPQIISNTATKILGRCGDIADYTSAGHSIGLSSEQIHWAQINLEPGMFIAKLAEGSWRYPFLFKVPLLNLPKTLLGNSSGNNPFPELKTTIASEFAKWGQSPEINLSGTDQIFDSTQQLEFCKAVAKNPMQPSSAYPKLAGISSKNAKKIRFQLISKKFIKEHKLDSGSRGRGTILLEILPAGFSAIQKCEVQI